MIYKVTWKGTDDIYRTEYRDDYISGLWPEGHTVEKYVSYNELMALYNDMVITPNVSREASREAKRIDGYLWEFIMRLEKILGIT